MITDQLATMEALTKRMEAAAARIETAKGKGKGGTGGAQRGDAWHEKKRLRAERHRAGQQPPRVMQTQMCPSCYKNQPSQYCMNWACKNCCEAGYGGRPCPYHGMGGSSASTS